MHIVADIGGTKTRIARSDDLEKIGDPLIFDTEQSYERGVATLVESVKRLAGNDHIDAISIGITGSISSDHKMPLTTPHLPGWRGRPLARELEASLGTSVSLINDTAQVGLGEALFGAGRGADIVVYVTVSTGVNGVRIVGGKADVSAQGFEIGGQYLTIDGTRKTLEELVSGRGVEERYGVHPKLIENVSPVWEELAEVFAVGLHNTILHWSPDRVVLGGSMFNEIGIPVERVRAHVSDIMVKFTSVPDIVHSSLGEFGGLWGGLVRLKNGD